MEALLYIPSLNARPMPCIVIRLCGIRNYYWQTEEERISSSEVYTRPETLIWKNKKHKVPEVLLSGDHKKIEDWKNGKKHS